MNSHPPATPKRFSLLSFRCTLFPYSCRPSGFQMARSCQSQPIPGEDTTENLLVIMLVQFFKATLSQYLENIRTCWHLKKKKIFSFYLPASPTNTSTGVLVGLSPMTLYTVISTSYLLYFFNSENANYIKYYYLPYSTLLTFLILCYFFITTSLSWNTALEQCNIYFHPSLIHTSKQKLHNAERSLQWDDKIFPAFLQSVAPIGRIILDG